MEFKNSETGKAARPWYVKGRSAASQADEILIASPWVYNGTRAVVFGDHNGRALQESIFQEALAKILAADGLELVK